MTLNAEFCYAEGSFMMSVADGDCRKQSHYAECLCAECRYAEFRGAINIAKHSYTWEIDNLRYLKVILVVFE